MPISCHFQDCKALLVLKKHVRSAIASTWILPFYLYLYACSGGRRPYMRGVGIVVRADPHPSTAVVDSLWIARTTVAVGRTAGTTHHRRCARLRATAQSTPAAQLWYSGAPLHRSSVRLPGRQDAEDERVALQRHDVTDDVVSSRCVV